MKQGNSNKLSRFTVYSPTSLILLLWAESASAAQSSVLLNRPENNEGSIVSTVGIAMVSIGCLIFLISIARHVAGSRRSKKTFSIPVLFDKLDSAGIAKLQQQITQVGNIEGMPQHVCEPDFESPDIFREICESEPAETLEDEEFAVTASHAQDDPSLPAYYHSSH